MKHQKGKLNFRLSARFVWSRCEGSAEGWINPRHESHQPLYSPLHFYGNNFQLAIRYCYLRWRCACRCLTIIRLTRVWLIVTLLSSSTSSSSAWCGPCYAPRNSAAASSRLTSTSFPPGFASAVLSVSVRGLPTTIFARHCMMSNMKMAERMFDRYKLKWWLIKLFVISSFKCARPHF